MFYNEVEFNKLTFIDQIYATTVVLMQVYFGHIEMLKDKNSFLWEMSSNASINHMLKEKGLESTLYLINLKEAEKSTALELYENLADLKVNNGEIKRCIENGCKSIAEIKTMLKSKEEESNNSK